nr:zinc finger, CCHC-type [Tanacetum cinerariifolium]
AMVLVCSGEDEESWVGVEFAFLALQLAFSSVFLALLPETALDFSRLRHASRFYSGATTHVCKDRCWFKTYEPMEEEYVLYMGDDHYAPVHGKRSVALEFSSEKTITLFNVLYVPNLGKNLVSGLVLNKCGYKQVYESDKYILSKSSVFVGFGYYNNGMFILNLNKVLDDSSSVYMSSSTVVNTSLWHAHLGHVHNKRMLEMSKDDLIPAIDDNLEKCTTCMLMKITKQPFKSIIKKSVILELIHSDLCDFYATSSLGNKKYVITFIDDASRLCYVYLLHAKDKALDKSRISKTEVELQQNDLIKNLCTDRGGEYCDPVFFQYVGIIHETTAPYTTQQNGVAERKNRALKEMVNSMLSYSGFSKGFWGEAMLTACYLLNRVHNKRNKTIPYELWYKKRPNMDFLFYVIEPNDSVSINSIIESRDKIFDENHFSLILRPKDIILNLNESQRDDHSDNVPIEGSRDQVGSQCSYFYSIEEDPRTYEEVMQSCDVAFWKEAINDEIGSIMENNIWVLSDLPPGCKPLGFRQKEGNDYFDTYAPVARITTIRLLLGLAAIHNLEIHQMDVKTAFLNGNLEEEVYLKQPEGFVMPSNEHKVCKLVKSLYGLNQAPKQWHQKFDDVVLSSGFLLNQSDKCVYSKFDSSESHYIEKILKKFNCEDCSPVSTPMDPVEKLKPNTSKLVDQLEYSRAIGCLMYAMTSTRPDIAYAVGTMNYGLSYVGYPSVLEAYSDASWINHVEDSSFTSGWVFLLGGGVISWASKKQTCITGSTMESEFVALATAGKEAE